MWPVEGKVQFERYSTRYREGLDLVLKQISCDIRGGEKVSDDHEEECDNVAAVQC